MMPGDMVSIKSHGSQFHDWFTLNLSVR